MSNLVGIATLDGSNYPKCANELAERVRSLLVEHAEEKEVPISIIGIEKNDAIQFGLIHSEGRQSLAFPIQNDSLEIIGWTLKFVKYQSEYQQRLQSQT